MNICCPSWGRGDGKGRVGIILLLSRDVRLWPVNCEWVTCVISEALSLRCVRVQPVKPPDQTCHCAQAREGWLELPMTCRGAMQKLSSL